MTTQRISTRTLSDAISASISMRNQRLLKLQLSIADGRAVHMPSDDPVRTQQSMWYREQKRAAEQYERSLQSVTISLSATESTLSNISDLLSEVRELQVRGASDALSDDARDAYASEVNQDLELLISLANERFAGTYTFGGRNNLQAPYVAERDAAGQIIRVSTNPAGIDGKLVRRVRPDVELTINVRGADLFGEGAAAFQSLIDLRTVLESGDGEGIRAMEAPLETAVDRVVKAHAVHGALTARAETLLAGAGRDLVTYEEGRSRTEDLDVARAMVDLQQEQVALQAALQSGAKILNLSLLDYLA
jgi:flagellar hook-associated protein 3 FlgL